jgi:recombination protein RecR
LDYPAPLSRLIDELKRLPGIGPKSAQRIAFHLLRRTKQETTALASAVDALLDEIRLCSVCNAFTDQEVCDTCRDASRSDAVICVIEEPHNIVSVERTRDFRGRYHVLHGSLSPLQGVGPDELKIHGLLERIRGGAVQEVILATSPTVEGESTAVYLARLLKPLGVRVTRIAMGIPVGSDLEWADEITMSKALEGRREY